MGRPQNPRTPGIIAQIQGIIAETGIRKASNLLPLVIDRGITTPEGLRWKLGPFRNFCANNGILKDGVTHGKTEEAVTEIDRDRLVNQEGAVRQVQGIVTQEDHSVIQAGESDIVTQCETPEDVTQPQEAVLQDPPAESKPTYAQDSVLHQNTLEDVLQQEHTVRWEQPVIQVQDTIPQAPREAVLQDNTGVTHEEMLAFLREHKGSLVELLEFWTKRKDELMKTGLDLTERPRFKRAATITKTIRLSETLVEDAQGLCEKQRAVTGGSFSGLVELLLWRYLGSDPKYLQEEPAVALSPEDKGLSIALEDLEDAMEDPPITTKV